MHTMETSRCFLLTILCNFHLADFQTITTIETHGTCTRIANNELVTFRCTTPDFSENVIFRKDGVNVGGCIGGNTINCFSSNYDTPTRIGTKYTELKVLRFNDSTDSGNWTCVYGISESSILEIELTECSTSSQSGSEWWKCFLIVLGSVCGIVIILYVNYRCSNKNCKTHAKCWRCSSVFYSDYPLLTRNVSKEWNVEHYCCSNPCCPIKGCNKKCCSSFLCCGCCTIEFPAERVKENGQPLNRPPLSSSTDEQENNIKRKKKKKAKHSVKENNDEPNPPDENSANDQQGNNTKHAKEEKAVHTATVNNTQSEPNPPGERRISLDSLNSKSNKIHPEEDKQVNNTKKLDPMKLKSGHVEIAHSTTPRPYPVLPSIDQKTS